LPTSNKRSGRPTALAPATNFIPRGPYNSPAKPADAKVVAETPAAAEAELMKELA